MCQRVYIETTTPSYFAARPGRDLLQAARQQITQHWWRTERHNYDLYVSQIVIDEVALGDAEAAQRRLLILSDLPMLALTTDVDELALKIMASQLLPPRASRDAIHIAVASVHNIDILLTWNCKHIANAAIIKELGRVVINAGYEIPVICTPEELCGE